MLLARARLVSICGVALVVLLAQRPLGAQGDALLLGTWVLDVSKSTFDSTVPFFGGTPPARRTMRFERVGDRIRHVIETGTFELREAYRIEYAFKIDGRDYPADAQMPLESVSFRWIDGSTLERIGKRRDGQVIHTVTYRVSDDRKTLTATERGTNRNAAGDEFPINSVQVFVRQ